MARLSDSDLRQLARDVLGREIDDAQICRFRPRLVAIARVKALLRDWEARLGETDPMPVTRVSDAAEPNHDSG